MKKFFCVIMAGALCTALKAPVHAADDCGTALATDDCNRDAIGVVNVVRNSSFEVGTDGWSILRGEYLKSISNPTAPTTPTFIAPTQDTTTATHGATSLKITNPNKGSWRLMSREFQLDPGQEYQLSFDAKSSMPDEYMNVRIAFGDGLFEQHAQFIYPTTSWARYTLPAFTMPAGRRHANIEIEYNIYSRSDYASDISLDAFQVRKTPNSAYLARPQDVGVIGPARPWTTAVSQNVGVSFKLRNNTTSAVNRKVHYTVVDEYFDKVISQGDTAAVSIGANATVTQTVTNVSPKKRGKYILSYQLVDSANGMIYDRGQYDFAVFDTVKKGANQFTEAFSVSNTVTEQGGRPLGIAGESTDIYMLYNSSAEDYFDLRAEAGDRWLRSWDFNWCNIEPVDNQFNWTLLDYVVDQAAARGMRVMPCLGAEFILDQNGDPPQWLRDAPGTVTKSRWPYGGQNIILPPQAQWSAYVTAVVNRYKDRINTWEVLNEPQMWMEPADYLPYLQTAYAAIKAADPNARVVAFTASQDYGSDPFAYLRECFDNGGLNYADIVDFHPYTARMDWSEPTTQDAFNKGLRQFVNDYGGTGKPIWNGELYHLTKSRPGVDDRWILHTMKGHEIARRYLLDLATGVERSFCFDDSNYNKLFLPTSQTDLLFRTGGLAPTTFVPIYNTITKFFEGSVPGAEVNVRDKVKLLHFTKPGDVPIGAVWSFDDNNQPTTITIPSAADKIQMVDIMGNDITQPASGNLTVTFSNTPVYLVPRGSVTPSAFRALLNGVGTGTTYLPIYPENSGFEFPYTANYTYNPSNAGWTFSATSGVRRNGGSFGSANSPQGTQSAMLQNLGSITQTVNFSIPGTYTITYKGAQRAVYQSGPQSIALSIAGTVVDTWTPSSTSFSTHSYSFTVASAGTKVIKLQGTQPVTADSTAYVDDIVFTH